MGESNLQNLVNLYLGNLGRSKKNREKIEFHMVHIEVKEYNKSGNPTLVILNEYM